MRFVPFAALLPLLFVVACSKSPATGGGMMHMPPPEVSVVDVQPTDVPVSYEYIGQTVGSREVEVRARVTGHVDKRLYSEGAMVRAGQPLFQLDPRPLAVAVDVAKAAIATAEADIARAEANSTQARREQQRLAPLAESHAISQKQADDAASADQVANADVLAAKARLEQARAQLREAQLNLEYATITAPISGMMGKALREEGSLVTANGDSLLTTLVQLDPLYVTFNVADEERQRLDRDVAEGSLLLPKGGFRVRMLERNGTQIGASGKINYISPTVSNQTGTLEMRGEFANPGSKIKSGLFVRVMLEGAIRPHALTVPQRAVLDGPNGKFVMVAGSKDGAPVAVPHPVELAEWAVGKDGEKIWVVRSGLQSGDKVIVDNLMKLRPGAPVTLAKPAAAPAGEAAPAKH